jgi:hypothetical protein
MGMCQVHDLALTRIFEILVLHLFGPRAYVTDVPVTYMDATPILGAFDVRGLAMETPVSNLVAEAAVPPHQTVFVGVLGVVGSALTAIVLCELHDGLALRWCLSFLLQHGMHSRLVEGWPLQRGPRSCRAASCPSLIRSTESWGT